MPKFSVIIPLYNKEKHIKNTLLSVIRQTYTDFEVIVVDDGSTDNSLKEIDDIKDNRLKIVSQKNGGVSVARNTGIRMAKGYYISFLDADDSWNTEYLSTINQLTIKYSDSDIYVTGYRILLPNNKINYSSTFYNVTDGCESSYWETLGNRYEFVWTSATTLKKSSIIKAGYFKPGEAVGEDLDLFSRVAQVNPKVAFSSSRCVDYNRCAENNARVSNKVAYPKAYLSVLIYEKNNPERTMKEKNIISKKYDRKVIAYIYTLILSNEKDKAKKTLESWQPYNNRIFKVFLRIAYHLPNFFLKKVYSLRLAIF